jgi:hypothetical protein
MVDMGLADRGLGTEARDAMRVLELTAIISSYSASLISVIGS